MLESLQKEAAELATLLQHMYHFQQTILAYFVSPSFHFFPFLNFSSVVGWVAFWGFVEGR